MNTLTMSPQDERDTAPGDQLPGRPRNKLLNRVTVPLLALLVLAGGFLGGIEVEKGHGGGGAIGSGRGIAHASAGSFSGGPGAGARAGAPGGFGPSAGGGTTGTISAISGRTIDLKESSGTTVKVTVTSVTSLKKDMSVTRNSIRPGDEITVEGISGSGGSIKASSISDSGHGSTTSSGSS